MKQRSSNANTPTLRGRKRTRFCATFSDPTTQTRKWFGMDNLDEAWSAFQRWIQRQGILFAYCSKVGCGHLVSRLAAIATNSNWGYVEADEVPDWVTGPKLRTPMLVSFSVSLLGDGRTEVDLKLCDSEQIASQAEADHLSWVERYFKKLTGHE